MCQFSAEVDGRMIEAVVKETVDTQIFHDDAVRSGQDSFMVQDKLTDFFMVNGEKKLDFNLF